MSGMYGTCPNCQGEVWSHFANRNGYLVKEYQCGHCQYIGYTVIRETDEPDSPTYEGTNIIIDPNNPYERWSRGVHYKDLRRQAMIHEDPNDPEYKGKCASCYACTKARSPVSMKFYLRCDNWMHRKFESKNGCEYWQPVKYHKGNQSEWRNVEFDNDHEFDEDE